MEQSGKTTQPDELDDLDKLERLIGKALLDARFRAYLLEDPAGASAEIGLELSGYQLARLKSLNPDAIEVVAAGFREAVPMQQQLAAGLW